LKIFSIKLTFSNDPWEHQDESNQGSRICVKDHTQPIKKRGTLMVSPVLVRSENELREFYEWLLCRAQEEEGGGRENNGRVYRDYAETVKKEINAY
jgi:hypothetical protein